MNVEFGLIWIKIHKGSSLEKALEKEQWIKAVNCTMMLKISATTNDVQKKKCLSRFVLICMLCNDDLWCQQADHMCTESL